jgi:hypothetical protein
MSLKACHVGDQQGGSGDSRGQPCDQRNGTESNGYLADKLSPLVGGTWPAVRPIAVNLPW